MARLSKFASVNFNDSYGKTDHNSGSANSSNNGSSGSGKPRSASGGMLVLTRPRSTPPPSSSSKPTQSRLGIPSPVNLPSLKREISGGDPLAVSPPLVGWTKGESPPLPVWAKGESPAEGSPHPQQQRLGLSKSLDIAGDTPNFIPLGKSNVYAPPALRGIQSSTTPTAPLASSVEKLSIVIRGEEFPTLQAAAARPPTPPQHPRQKDLQQKQLEVKEHQLRMQQPSLLQGQKQIHGDSSQEMAAYQPCLSLRPLTRQEPLLHKPNVEPGPSLSSSSLINRQSSPQADRSLSRSPPMGITNRTEATHSFRPQYRTPMPVSPSSEARRSQVSDALEPSWLSSSRREFVQPSRNDNLEKPFEGTTTMDDLGSLTLELRSSQYNRESFFSKYSSTREEVMTTGLVRGDTYAEYQGFSREASDSRVHGRFTRLHDVVPRIEGFDNQRSSWQEAYNRDPKEATNRMIGDSSNRDAVDVYCKDVRENQSRDIGVAYDRDVSEAYSRGTSRDMYTKDVKEVYNQNVSMNRPSSYGYVNNNSQSLRRGNALHNDYLHGRGGLPAADATSVYSLGSDASHSRRYGPRGSGDQSSAREVRPSPDFQGSRESALYNPIENFGSRRVRSPALGRGTHDPVKEVHEVHFEKLPRYCEEDRQPTFEDKRVNAKDVDGFSCSVKNPESKREGSQGSPVMGIQSSQIQKVDGDVVISGEKQLLSEDQRRKEAARMKLLELEEKIARRAAQEGRKEEGESKDDNCASPVLLNHQVGEPMPVRKSQVEQESKGSMIDRDMDGLPWRQEESGAKLPTRPSSASSAFSHPFSHRSDYKTQGHASQEQDYRPVGESDLNQDRRVVQSRSSGSWRKDMGNGPTSKLFSAPYVESGGIRRPSDGGTYKLF